MIINDRVLMLQGSILEATPSRRNVITDIRIGVRVNEVFSRIGVLTKDMFVEVDKVVLFCLKTTGPLEVTVTKSGESVTTVVNSIMFADCDAESIVVANPYDTEVAYEIRAGINL